MTSNGHDRARPLRTGDPEELGAYRIVGRLGRGGMGTVYLAKDTSDRHVAIKLIHPDLSDDDAFRRRFAREVEAARRVARFSTAGVLDARIEDDPLYIVSEYVPGPNLSEAVHDDDPMYGGTLESLSMGVAAALTAIHGAGVIHRDLKPANVLLSSVGPKVIDFGIARAMDDDSAVTRSSQLMGTPAYLAPELIMGGEVTPASDIFSWGCLVAYAGTGKAPFDASTVPAVLHQISSGAPRLDGLDDRLHSLVAQALDKEPTNRPTAQQLLNNLVGQENPAESTVDSTVSRSWTPPSTARPGGGAAPAVAGAAGAAAGAAMGAAASGAPDDAGHTQDGGIPTTSAAGGPSHETTAPTTNLDAQATTAMGPDTPPPAPTHVMHPGGAPSGPQAPGHVPSGPQAPGLGQVPSGPQAPGPGQVLSGPQLPGHVPPMGPPAAMYGSPPYGPQTTHTGLPPGVGMPPGPGVSPGAPDGPPPARRRRRTVLIAGGAVALVLCVVAAIGAVRFLSGPSFPEGSLIYSDEFDDMESGWDSPYDAAFDPADDFQLAGYTDDEQYAMRATTDDTRMASAAAFEGETPDQVGISVDVIPQSGPEYGETGVFCFANSDAETAYTITTRLDGTGAQISREAGEGGSSTLEETTEISSFVTEDDQDEPLNTLQATCELDEEQDIVTIRLWVNDSFVLEAVDDEPLDNGTTALLVQRDGGGSGGDALVHFDNYRLTEIDTGEEGG